MDLSRYHLSAPSSKGLVENDMSIAEMVRTCVLMDVLVAALLPGLVLSDTRLAGKAPQHAAEIQNHQHDFDFEFGNWKAHLRRLLHPLRGSEEWVEYDGTSVVRKIWNGDANLGEFNVTGTAGHIEGMSLRLYHPDSHRWSIYWANRKDGDLTVPPMIGGFEKDRGEFYDHEIFLGKPIMVRFIFSNITPTSFRLEQAFSPDGGKTWERNWIATFTREKQL